MRKKLRLLGIYIFFFLISFSLHALDNKSSTTSPQIITLTVVPEEVQKLFKKNWGIKKIYTNNTKLKQFESHVHPELQDWIDSLTLLFLETRAARNAFSFTLVDPYYIHLYMGVSIDRAIDWWGLHNKELLEHRFTSAQVATVTTFKTFNPRIFGIGVTPKSNMVWSGLTAQDLVTSIVLEENKINPVIMLEHLIHEAAVLHDPRGFDNRVFLEMDRRAQMENRSILPKDLEHLHGLAHPALSLAMVNLRALRFEQQVFAEIENKYKINLTALKSFKEKITSEAFCKKLFSEFSKTLGNFDDTPPTKDELEQIERKLKEFLPKLNCLKESTPNFKLFPNYQRRYPGPRCRMGGG